jgi:hypothetical protein
VISGSGGIKVAASDFQNRVNGLLARRLITPIVSAGTRRLDSKKVSRPKLLKW